MFAGNKSSGMCVARFREAPASTHQALSTVAHVGYPGHYGNGYYKRYYSQGGANDAVRKAKVKIESKRFGLLSHGGCSGVD